jgi:hypothetical protein
MWSPGVVGFSADVVRQSRYNHGRIEDSKRSGATRSCLCSSQHLLIQSRWVELTSTASSSCQRMPRFWRLPSLRIHGRPNRAARVVGHASCSSRLHCRNVYELQSLQLNPRIVILIVEPRRKTEQLWNSRTGALVSVLQMCSFVLIFSVVTSVRWAIESAS